VHVCVASVKEDSWHTIMHRIWPQFMPLPLHDDDAHPCSFSAIFADPFSAAFYSLTWAEVSSSHSHSSASSSCSNSSLPVLIWCCFY